MNRLFALLSICLLNAPVQAGSAADEAFENLAEDFISDLVKFSPVGATSFGDHRADDQLDHVDANARANATRMYSEYLEVLSGIDREQLSRANQVDMELLRNDLESGLWSIEVLQEWAWNPLYYVRISGGSIYSLVARDFAPAQDRLTNVAARLEQLPRFFEEARASLQPDRVPKIHAETAVRQTPGLLSIINNMVVPDMDKLSPEALQRLEAAIEIAKDAIANHQTWLEEELVPRANGDFRLGAELFDHKLAFTLNSPLSRKEIVARAEEEYASVRDEMYEVSKQVYADLYPQTVFPDNADTTYKQAIIRAALEQAYKELPPPDGVVEMAERHLQTATDFVIERNIVTMPDEPVEIIVMPEFRRGVSLAYLDAPGPLDREQSAFYAVAPLPADWNAEQIQSFLREYNSYSMQVLSIHEGTPGHYLQLAHSNRYPSLLRGVLSSGPFIEGWAEYAERVMIDEGYLDGNPLMRLIQLKWYLRAVTNSIIDSSIHVDGMTREAAMQLMIEGGFQEEREAAGKWVRAQLSSTQLSTYFVGYQEHIGLRRDVEAAWGDEFTLRRYHDQALSYGSPPVKFVRALMLNEPIPTSSP